MRISKTQLVVRCAATILTLMLSLIFALNAQSETLKVLHNFDVSAGDGNIPYSGLVEDAAGNLYGTTLEGGAHGFGTVYRLSPTSGGDYEETILYSFKGGPADGANPHAPLFRDSAGNLYSTTVAGGINAAACNSGVPASGCGIVFKLTPTTTGEWTETVLHRFTGTDGGSSYSGLVRDAAGNFYGATLLGGGKGLGTVYQLNPTSTGWKERVLHSFAGNADGAEPFVNCTTLALDGHGNLYGSTYVGGAADAGTVFKLTRQTSGAWTERILHTFQGGADGAKPLAGVILDKSGNVYGTTTLGGSGKYGTVFKLTAANDYAKTILHNFSLSDVAVAYPNGLIFDASGNLIGTTEYAAFKLTHESTGWSESLIWDWNNALDGVQIFAPVMMDAQGNLWGTTTWGGTAGDTTGGVAFELVP
jgi:uncharacterized repeat protein (TIGR03803 family)